MIYDPSNVLSGDSITRLSNYLTLCKIDMLVRGRRNSTQPEHRSSGKAEARETHTRSNHTRSNPVRLVIDYSKHIGNKSLTLQLKQGLVKQKCWPVTNVSNAGSVTLRTGNRDIEILPLYEVSVSDFASSHKIAMKCCLAFSKQERWVSGFLDLVREQRLKIDYLLVVNHGCIGHFQCCPSKEE